MAQRFVFPVWLGLLLVVLFPACIFFQTQEKDLGNYYLSPEFSKSEIRRVGCLPIQKETFCFDDLSTIQSVFLQELKRKGVFEVIPLTEEELVSFSRLSQLKGAYPSAWVLELKNRYRLDGILVAYVTQYNPYKPKTFGLKGELINSRTGDVAWSVDVLFDSGEKRTLEDMEIFFTEESSSESTPFDWKLPLFSKKHFLMYAFSRTFQTLKPEFTRKKSSRYCGVVIRVDHQQLP